MTKRDVCGVISAQARAANRHARRMAFAPRQIEDVIHNHIFIGVVSPHSIRRMNPFVVKTFEINRVRTVNSQPTGIDVTSNGADQSEILVLVISSERSWKKNQR